MCWSFALKRRLKIRNEETIEVVNSPQVEMLVDEMELVQKFASTIAEPRSSAVVTKAGIVGDCISDDDSCFDNLEQSSWQQH